MNTKTITSAILAAVIGFSLGMSATTLAGDRDHRRHDSGRHEVHQDRHFKQHRRHSNRHNKQYAKRHYKGHNKHYYRGHNRHNYNRRHYSHGGYGPRYYNYDDNDDDLWIGLVVGGILGYAINNSQYAH